MRAVLALVAALVAAAGPLAGSASAKCTEPMSTVCNAYVTVCSKLPDKLDPPCGLQP